MYFAIMEHRGEILEKAIRKSEFSITAVARHLNRSSRWLYYQFENEYVPLDSMLKIGRFIRHDFSKELKQLKEQKELSQGIVIEESNMAYDESRQDVEYWKNKCLELYEKYTKLLEQLEKPRD
jgi:hypothetical protein